MSKIKNMKQRLDIIISHTAKLSRNKAQSLIEEGHVLVEQKVVTKPSLLVDENSTITLSEHFQYVSRGAYKLLGAIEAFDLHFKDKVVLDMGASTGGFTQVALIHGASKVYSVDIGESELDISLALNEKVVNMPSCDIRSLCKEVVSDVDIVVGDLSFISLQHILPHINRLFGKIEMILLFKPQFECGKEIAKKFRGVIKDKKVHEKLLCDFVESLKLYNWQLSNITSSPIKGKSGNIEYLLFLNGKNDFNFDIKDIVENVFKVLK